MTQGGKYPSLELEERNPSKPLTHQEDPATVTVHAPKHMTRILTDREGEIDSTAMVEAFSFPGSAVDGSWRQKPSKETLDLSRAKPFPFPSGSLRSE